MTADASIPCTPRPSGNIQDPHPRITWQIAAATLSRLTVNTARRFAYPYALVISQGLGVPLIAVTSLIAINQGTGLAGLYFGPLGDRIGYRRLMLAGSAILAVGMIAGGLFPVYIVVAISFFLAGLGKSVYDPAIQAFVSRCVPYSRRGWAIGLIELSWAGSSLMGIPAIGILIGQFGWRAPFFALGVMGVLGFAAIAFLLPVDEKAGDPAPGSPGIFQLWSALLHERRALGAVSFAFLVSVAYDIFFVVYGIWLAKAFGLGIAAIGAVTIVIGVAELFGEGLTATVADRLGLSRSVFTGLAVSILCFLGFPFVGNHLILGIAFLFFLFCSLEFAIVCSMSLFTEFFPKNRAAMMSAFFAAASIGRVFGAMFGFSVWELWGGVWGTGLVCAFILAGSAAVLMWGIRTWKPASVNPD